MSLDANGDPVGTNKRRSRKQKPSQAADGEEAQEETPDDSMEEEAGMEGGMAIDDGLNTGDLVPAPYAALGIMAPELDEARWVVECLFCAFANNF